MKKRIVSLLLAVLMLAFLTPLPRVCAFSSGAEIMAQIEDIYAAARSNAHLYSFYRKCAALVNWEVYLLGITKEVTACNGNGEYDAYCKKEVSSGGYHITPYGADQYTLSSALNTISMNGTRDVYNIVVGFQWSNTTLGRRYGHTCFINAILDGMVYYCESFDLEMNGKMIREGKPIVCSIEDFCDYYADWTVFDGVIYFGIRDYVDACTAYPAHLYVRTQESMTMRAYPCGPEIDALSQSIRAVGSGERLYVTALYRNAEGEYWYQIQENDKVGYIPAEETYVAKACLDDIRAVDVAVPGILRPGEGFTITGTVASRRSTIGSVVARVYDLNSGSDKPVLQSVVEPQALSCDLQRSGLAAGLAFSSLPIGHYRLLLSANAAGYCLVDGHRNSLREEEKLWQSDFYVSDSTDFVQVRFDGNGGNAELDSVLVRREDMLTELPGASRTGYLFDGWYTEEGTALEIGQAIAFDMSVFARWTRDSLNGWYCVDGVWHAYLNGEPLTGWHRVEGLEYCFTEDGAVRTGWALRGLRPCYLNASGAAASGTVSTAVGSCRFREDGTPYPIWEDPLLRMGQ